MLAGLFLFFRSHFPQALPYSQILILVAIMILPLHIPYLKRVVVSLVFLYPMAFPKDKDVSMLCELPTSSDVKHLNSMQFRDLLIRFGNCTAIAQHRRWSRHGGYVTLINATPYDWNLTSMHQNQMEYDFPSLISAGRLAPLASSHLINLTPV